MKHKPRFRSRKSEIRNQKSGVNSWPLAISHLPSAISSQLPAFDHAGRGLAYFGFLILDFGLGNRAAKLPTAHRRLPTANCLLLTPDS